MKDDTRPPAAFFPTRAERARLDDFLTHELPRANARIAQGSVVPTFDLATFKKELAGFDFRTPRALDELMSWSIAQLEHGIVHMTHPRYFGLFNPAPTFPAECADRIVGAFNPQLATWTTAPAAVEIEAHVVKAVACARVTGGCRGTLHLGRLGGELHGAPVRLDARQSALRDRGGAGFRRRATLLYLPGQPPRLAQDCPSDRHRPRGRAARADRRPRPA
jgi:hypothetical protein